MNDKLNQTKALLYGAVSLLEKAKSKSESFDGTIVKDATYDIHYCINEINELLGKLDNVQFKKMEYR